MQKVGRNYSIQAVENALSLLEVLGTVDEVKLGSLSKALGLTKSKVFRLLATFEKRGYVKRSARSGSYTLGPTAFEVGGRFLFSMQLLKRAKPKMLRLARELGEAVYLAVPHRSKGFVFIDMVDTSHQVAIASLVGRSYPLRSTAVGHVLLAFGAVARERSGASGEDLSEVRRVGYARDCHALGEHVRCVAVPVHGEPGRVVGALCVVAPSFRLTERGGDEKVIPRLQSAAGDLARVGGYGPVPEGAGVSQ
ncbi:MAG: IclR family transcriptional regulator [Desulfuromonadales bacterium]|nr:IclR family transcriptional regulator [Desulfuromonadales bacterium]NIS39213.1 IclR family transcriptional regulator [Desulfuromonadales bacterium]